MTPKELNRNIKNLALYIKGIAQAADADMTNDNTAYFEKLTEIAQPEFIRLINADSSFKSFTAESLRIIILLNRRHKFVPLHTIGYGIEI